MKLKFSKQDLLLALSVPALLVYYFATNPFSTTLTCRSIGLSGFSAEQRQNFLAAGTALNGAVIKPHGTFSFNGRLGARTGSRGYVPAPSYVSGEKVSTSGGGICLISSTLYQLALLSGLEVIEREPHVKTVASVPPGLDATVWYGVHDLKLKNPYPYPVAIKAEEDNNELKLSILAEAGLVPSERTLSRRELARDNHRLLVEVFLKEGGKDKLVSRDSYTISR